MQYHVIDMANVLDADLELVSLVFKLWSDVYSRELEIRNQALIIEEFWNCRLLAVIEENGVVIGCHLYNSFDLRTQVIKHKYFLDITPSTIEDLKRSGTYRLMSMEYLLVNPDFRGIKSSVRWSEVVIGLGFKVMTQSPWDAIVGIARADKHVNTMGMKMGAKQTDVVEKYQTPCRVMIMTKAEMKRHDDTYTQKTIDRLWAERLDHSPWILSNQRAVKAA